MMISFFFPFSRLMIRRLFWVVSFEQLLMVGTAAIVRAVPFTFPISLFLSFFSFVRLFIFLFFLWFCSSHASYHCVSPKSLMTLSLCVLLHTPLLLWLELVILLVAEGIFGVWLSALFDSGVLS